MKNLSYFFLLIFSFTLFSCSKDDVGSKEPEPNEPELQTGVFVDSEVRGLTYETETQNGITNENGEFFYYEGETVTFSVGDIELGSAEGASKLTPISIASTPDATVESQEVKNIAAFLQSLDSDADPSNGITIESAVVEVINVNEINFTGNIVSLLGEMVAHINLETGSELNVVYPEVAAIHMAESLGEIYEPEINVFTNFLPTFTTYNSPGAAVNSSYWVHDIDEEGKLVKSRRFEKYPNNLRLEISYTNHNEFMLPTNYQLVNIRNDIFGNPFNFSLEYSDSNVIKQINTLNEGETIGSSVIIEMDEKRRATKVKRLDSNGNFVQRGAYVFNDEGNIIEQYIYDSETGSDFLNKIENSFTNFGDLDLTTTIDGDFESYRQYFYRENHTKEKVVTTNNSNETVTTVEFNESENVTRSVLEFSSTTIIRYFHENGVRSKEEHYDADGNLIRIDTFDEDGYLISSESY